MPIATSILDRLMVFQNVPIKSTFRGFAIPTPAVLRSTITHKPNPKDKEWDGRSASFSWDKTQQKYYLGTMKYTVNRRPGFEKTITDAVECSYAEWVDAHHVWAGWLTNNAETYTNTSAMVIKNATQINTTLIRRSRSGAGIGAIQAAVAQMAATPAPVPTFVPVPAGPLPLITWDPNDPDLALDLFEVPDDNPDFIPDLELYQIINALWEQCIRENAPRTLLIMGHTSTGKTEAPIVWAARNDALHCRIDCGQFGEIYDVTGPIKAIEKNGASMTQWVPGKTIRAMADPRPAVIQLDEINRISDVKAMNVLFPFFDSARRSYFDDNQTWMKLNGAKLIIATMNGDTRGDDIGEYVGTQPLDQAFISRFPVRRQLQYPNEVKLVPILAKKAANRISADDIHIIAQVATELVALNKFVPNLRELFAAIDFLATGTDMYHALKWTVGGVYKDDSTPASDYASFRHIIVGKGIPCDDD